MLDSFLALLQGERPRRTVWTADITYWIAGEKQAGRAKPEWDTEIGYLQLHKDLGLLPYYYYEKFIAARTVHDETVQTQYEQRSDATRHTLTTPVGSLTEENRYLADSSCWGCVSHFVENPADLDVLLYILEHRRLEPANLDDYNERRELWRAYDGLPSLGLPRSPLPSLCYEWAGLEQAVYLMLDCPDKVSEAFTLMGQQESPILDAVGDLAPPLVHFADNLSSTNLTSLYADHLEAHHKGRLSRLHSVGTRCVVHLDGTVAGLLPKLTAAGFDGVEALTPKPAGDLSMAEMAQLVDPDPVILWGGVPGVMFSPPYMWEAMRTHIHELLDAWEDRPFVVGVADQVPPDGDISFCPKIARELEKR